MLNLDQLRVAVAAAKRQFHPIGKKYPELKAKLPHGKPISVLVPSLPGGQTGIDSSPADILREFPASVLTTDTSGAVQVRTSFHVGHWAGLLSGLAGHSSEKSLSRLARNRRRPSAQGTDAQAEARGLRVEAEQSRVALRFDLHVARGTGRIAGRDRKEPAPGDQAQNMPHARGA